MSSWVCINQEKIIGISKMKNYYFTIRMRIPVQRFLFKFLCLMASGNHNDNSSCQLAKRLGLENTLDASQQRLRPQLPNDCPWHDTKQSDGEVLGMWGTPSLPSLLGPFWSGVVAPVIQTELNCVLMLNWFAWKQTVLTFKLCTYAKLNCLK